MKVARLHAYALLFLSSASPAVVGLVSIKAIFLSFGSEGLAEFVEFRRFVALMGPLLLFGQGLIIARSVAMRAESSRLKQQILTSGACCAIMALMSLFLSTMWVSSEGALGDIDLTDMVLIFTASIASVVHSFAIAFHRGRDDIKSYSFSVLMQTCVIPCVAVVTCWNWNIDGMLVTWVALQTSFSVYGVINILKEMTADVNPDHSAALNVSLSGITGIARQGLLRVVGDGCVYGLFLLPVLYASNVAFVGVMLTIVQATTVLTSPLSVRLLAKTCAAWKAGDFSGVHKYILVVFGLSAIATGILSAYGQYLTQLLVGILADTSLIPETVNYLGFIMACGPYVAYISIRSVLDGLGGDRQYALSGILAIVVYFIMLPHGEAVAFLASISALTAVSYVFISQLSLIKK